MERFDKCGDWVITTKIHNGYIEGGHLGYFILKYKHISEDDDRTRSTCSTNGHEREEKLIRFERFGKQREARYCPLNVSQFHSPKIRDLIEKWEGEPFEYYIGLHDMVDGLRSYIITPISNAEKEYIEGWFDKVGMMKKKGKTTPAKSLSEIYAKEIEQATETGNPVVIYKNTRDSQSNESDTEIITCYIDGEENITEKVEAMD